MRKFNKGDIVVGNPSARRYTITSPGVEVEVLYYKDDDNMVVLLKGNGLYGGQQFDVKEECFDLVRPAWGDLAHTHFTHTSTWSGDWRPEWGGKWAEGGLLARHELLDKHNGDMLQRLTGTLKRILNKDMQAQYRAGYRDGELELTGRGRDELLTILSEKYEKELANSARDYIAALEGKSQK